MDQGTNKRSAPTQAGHRPSARTHATSGSTPAQWPWSHLVDRRDATLSRLPRQDTSDARGLRLILSTLSCLPGVGAWLSTGHAVLPNHGSSPTDRGRLGPAELRHPIQNTARKARLELAAVVAPRSKASPDDGLVAEEGILHTGLLMVARGFLPRAPPERFDVCNRAIAHTGAWSVARHPCCHDRRHYHLSVSRPRGLREGDRVVGRVRGDARWRTSGGILLSAIRPSPRPGAARPAAGARASVRDHAGPPCTLGQAALSDL
jgi:hypothetical protein